uniref:Uncharacterized protein n=1 Tax=Rhizophora mucronata TaxID=61149 RepID=A0A2P2IT95_RHIMU
MPLWEFSVLVRD